MRRFKLQFDALKNKSNDYLHLEKKYLFENDTILCDPFAVPPKIDSKKKLSATIVVPAGNSRSSIIACLTSIEQSSFNIKYRNRLQVVVVDDGSSDGTWNLVKKSRLSLNLVAIRQERGGQTRALNTGVSAAEGDIIISCDSDMVLGYYAIEHFMAIHEQLSDVLLVGFRSDTPKSDLRVSQDYMRQNGTHRYSEFVGDERIAYSSSGWPMNMSLASNHFKDLGYNRGLWMRDSDPWFLFDLVFGALFSLPKATYEIVGGYDERFEGWGCSDGYLASKAISVGNYVLPIYASSGLHISHSARNSSKWAEYKKNRILLKKLIETSSVDEFPDWLSKAKNRIVEHVVKTSTELSYVKSRRGLESLEPKHLRIDSLLAIGEYEKAVEIINKKNTKTDKDLLVRLGKGQFGLKNYNKAVDIFTNLSESLPEVLIDLALAQVAKSQFALAAETLKAYKQKLTDKSDLAYWNQSSNIYVEQGLYYFNQGFVDCAIRCFEIALVVQPSNQVARDYRKKCLKDM